MYLKPPENEKYRNWGHYENVFNKEDCAKIVEIFAKLPQEAGGINSGPPVPERRRSTIAWMHWNRDVDWVYQKLYERIKYANDTHYRYDLTMIQSIQLTRYAVDEHYIWHSDMSYGRNSIRKLSVTVQLTEPAEYEGGDLLFRTNVVEKAPKGQGTMVFFPSFIFHCVEPVTKGTRLSMVAWVVGPPLR